MRDADGVVIGVTDVSMDITEQKRAEEAVRDSEARYRRIVETANEGMWTIDADSNTSFVNTKMAEMLGYTVDEMLGAPLFAFMDEEGKAIAAANVERHRQGITEQNDFKFKRKDGYTTLSRWTEKPPAYRVPQSMYWVVGITLGLLTVAGGIILLLRRQVQARTQYPEQANAALRESEQRYQLISTVASGYMFSTRLDAGGNLVLNWVAGAFEAITGYTFAEYVARGSWRAALHPDELAADDRDLAKLRANQAVITEIRTLTKGGETRWVRVYAQPVLDAEHRGLVSIFGAVQDITVRKRTEIELRRKNRALMTLSACNQALVHLNDEFALLNEICRICVALGGYRLAWVGYAETDEGKRVRPVAQMGFEAGYLDTLNITWADTERGNGPTDTAIRTGHPFIPRNIVGDPSYVPWRDAALRRGYASSIALPLTGTGGIVGALNIYAAEVDAFDAKEVELLKELAGNLTYGVETLRTRIEHARAEEQIRQRVEELAALNALGWEVSQILSLDEVIGHAVRELAAAARADLTFLFLREGERLVLKGSLVQDASLRFGEIPEHRVGECMCGLAVREGKALYAPRHLHRPALYLGRV